MALAPRFPDLKANLDVTYGTFGTLVGFGTFGAFLSLMTMGHFIHKIGTFPVLFSSVAVMIACLLVISNTHSPNIFFVANFIFGMSWSSYHISVNTQTMHRQREFAANVIPFLHGMWTLGAVLSALVATLIANDVSLAWHMNTMGIIVGFIMLVTIVKIKALCIPARDVRDEDGAIGFVEMIKSFRIDWILSSAYLSVLLVEITVGDWSALFTRDILGQEKGISIVPYLVFMTSMIIGRLGYHRVMKGRDELSVVRAFIIIGGIFFTSFIGLSAFLSSVNPTLALLALLAAFFSGGLGSSFLGPYLFSFAAKRSPRPDSVALAELSATNTALTFLTKLVLAWVAQVAGLAFALLIPGLAFLVVAFYIRAVMKSPEKS
ncbi:MAG: MFS transporter [Actinobacteria bacterium]|nr:MFS transporter [Actinomycetota bacterium]